MSCLCQFFLGPIDIFTLNVLLGLGDVTENLKADGRDLRSVFGRDGFAWGQVHCFQDLTLLLVLRARLQVFLIRDLLFGFLATTYEEARKFSIAASKPNL